jgi:hypothetical protein
MEVEKIILIGLGTILSMVAFFLKKESMKIDRLMKRLREIEIDLAQNDARDAERWRETQKSLQEKREDINKIFDKINN